MLLRRSPEVPLSSTSKRRIAMVLYAIVIDPVYRDIQNVAHRVQVVKGVDGLNRGPTAMALLRIAKRGVALQRIAILCAAWRWDAPAPLVSDDGAVRVRS